MQCIATSECMCVWNLVWIAATVQARCRDRELPLDLRGTFAAIFLCTVLLAPAFSVQCELSLGSRAGVIQVLRIHNGFLHYRGK